MHRVSHRLVVRVLVAALAVTSAVALTAQPRTDIGAFVWYDLVTTDSASAREFYGKLLGWTFSDTDRNGRPYVIAHSGGRAIGGIVAIEPGAEAGSQWISYFVVDDVERVARDAVDAGGRLLVPPTKVASGRAAVVTDPQGAPVGFGSVKLPIPVVSSAPVGQFFWTDYLATDSAAALRFYERVAGLTPEAPSPQASGGYVVLRNGQPRAGLFALPAGTDSVRSHWLPYVRVADAAAAAAQASSLGGRVLLAPSPALRNGTLAIVADPSGAAIGLQKFPIEAP